jgi:dTDP-4-dehydrorhamnose reductase
VKLLVTGAGGGLGRAFVGWAFYSGLPDTDVAALSHAELDITDAAAVEETVAAVAPDAVINCAAFTNVDACETEPDTAFRANALGPQHLAASAHKHGAMVLHVSTDYVFDGEKETPYTEEDVPNPQSEYAKSKLAGEEFVRAVAERHFIVRTGWVFGGGSDFLSGAVTRLEAGERAGGLVDRTGTPTFVPHLAARLVSLVETGRFGTYHLTGPEQTTWFAVLKRAKELGGFPGELVEQHADELHLPAARARNSALVSLYTDGLGIEPMPPLDVALKEFLDDRRT